MPPLELELLELLPPEELEEELELLDELELPLLEEELLLELELLEEELLLEELDECPPDEEELLEEPAPLDEEEPVPLELPAPLDDDEAPLLPDEEPPVGLPEESLPQALNASAMIALASSFPLILLIVSPFSYRCVNRMPAPEIGQSASSWSAGRCRVGTDR